MSQLLPKIKKLISKRPK